MSLNASISRYEEANFRHLVIDIAWFGFALAANSRFLSVYAIRLGATPAEQSLISALPALVLLFSSMLGSWWLKRYVSTIKALRLPGFGMRFMFLLPLFAPVFPEWFQPWWIILSVTLPAIPQGVASVVFINMMREAVPPSQLGKLLGLRSVALNIALAGGALAFGLWLETAPFPFNYQSMFFVAFLAAMMSYRHIDLIKMVNEIAPDVRPPAMPWKTVWGAGPFRQVALITAISHISFTLLIAIIPLYLVRERGATEGFMALFGLVELVSGAVISMLAVKLAQRIGNRAMIALMMFGTALAAVVLAFSPSLPFTLIAAALTGACWMSVALIGLFGFFTENTPIENSTGYSTAYQQVIGLSTFIGPMLGTLLVNAGLELTSVIIVGAVVRAVAAVMTEFPVLTGVRSRRPQESLAQA
jgi:predicted MFS family arabinose efflux permease